MINKKIMALGFVVLIGFSLTGCKSLENTIVPDPVDVSSLKQYTPAEYETRMNNYLLSVMSQSQTILANNWQIETGGLSKADAIKILDGYISDTDQILRNIRQVTPPTTHVQHKNDLIKAVSDYSAYLIDYKSALQGTDKAVINSKAKRIEAQVGVLKNLQVLDQGYKF